MEFLVSHPFLAFEKERFGNCGVSWPDAPDHAAGTKQTYVNDMQARVHKNKSMQHYTLGSGTAKISSNVTSEDPF